MPYWIQATGYIASALVFATFCMTTMVPLRIAAISSNVGFIAYATFGHLYPVLVLHLALLPLNIFRTYRLIALDRKIQQAVREGFSIEWLKPLMKKRSARRGENPVPPGRRGGWSLPVAQWRCASQGDGSQAGRR